MPILYRNWICKLEIFRLKGSLNKALITACCSSVGVRTDGHSACCFYSFCGCPLNFHGTKLSWILGYLRFLFTKMNGEEKHLYCNRGCMVLRTSSKLSSFAVCRWSLEEGKCLLGTLVLDVFFGYVLSPVLGTFNNEEVLFSPWNNIPKGTAKM